MKFFISSDIEGTTGITDWNETELNTPEYKYFQEQMTREVNATCEALNEVGASEIFIKDAHDSGRNLIHTMLPKNTKILKGWTRNPYIMMAGLDNTYDAVLFTGYHSGIGSNKNPLAHTLSSTKYHYIKINGVLASEYLINSYTAAYFNVPVIFISGDKGICEEAKILNPNIKTAAVNDGIGNGSISIHPTKALELIKEGVKTAIQGDLSNCLIKLPEKFHLEISFRDHYLAYRASFYPGVMIKSENVITFDTHNYFEVLRMMLFI